MIIETQRLRLRCWEEADREAFAAMHADADVMRDYGGPISGVESNAKFYRYASTYRRHGFCRWAIVGRDGSFLGYAGIMPSRSDHPLDHIAKSAGDCCGTRGASDTQRRQQELR